MYIISPSLSFACEIKLTSIYIIVIVIKFSICEENNYI